MAFYISPLSMKFNEQPYLLKCVCVSPIFSYGNFCWWNVKRMCLWQPVLYSSHTDFTTQTNTRIVVFVCFFFIRVSIHSESDAMIDTMKYNICKTLCVGVVVSDIDIQMLIIPLSKKDIYLSKEQISWKRSQHFNPMWVPIFSLLYPFLRSRVFIC